MKMDWEENGKVGHDYSYLGLISAKSLNYGRKGAYSRDSIKQGVTLSCQPQGTGSSGSDSINE